ncbi:30S ribosomal protein S20 [Leptospira sp. GIMC2001]|uniref:30S ribosomal protein S20 n=1 Tax=Leptospira sp. GIMC2001 TaxID=1513297 RepID=UPI00234954EF|nr:30S ribosomal protein S20 [Leptospira sp. GIMC2001]WCL49308.1 30S ribosomal protein S20 [Leptospira sp. GIMC2001]
MANLKSSKKDIRRTIKRTAANASKKARLRTSAKNILKNVKEGNLEKASLLYKEYSSLLDKAAKTNLIHKGNASRKKSRMALLISKTSKAQSATAA